MTRYKTLIAGDQTAAIHYAADHFLSLAQEAIEKRGLFTVALSGGSTPKAIFRQLADTDNQIDWGKVQVFWSDERSVPPTDPESNYGSAMASGLARLPIPRSHVHRMKAEENIDNGALVYEQLIQETVPEERFDLIMLGMGEDGHTASLFPNTHALHVKNRLVAANYVPQKDTWRMTFTYDLINQARCCAFYILGQEKAETLCQVLTGPFDPILLPAQGVGTEKNPSLWILDENAARLLPPE